jgi:hypothetical protein
VVIPRERDLFFLSEEFSRRGYSLELSRDAVLFCFILKTEVFFGFG